MLTIVDTSLTLSVIACSPMHVLTYNTVTVLLKYFIITYILHVNCFAVVSFLLLVNYTNTHYMEFYVLFDISQL